MPTRLQIAKPDIIKYFKSLPRQVFDRSDIETILRDQRQFWRLANATTIRDFIKFLTKTTQLQTAKFEFPHRRIVKYMWGDVPLYALLLSLRSGCYLTHYTALYFHELTDQIPKVININFEQVLAYPPKVVPLTMLGFPCRGIWKYRRNHEEATVQ